MHPFAQVLSLLWTNGSVTFREFAEAWHGEVRGRVANLCRRDGYDEDEILDITCEVLDTAYSRYLGKPDAEPDAESRHGEAAQGELPAPADDAAHDVLRPFRREVPAAAGADAPAGANQQIVARLAPGYIFGLVNYAILDHRAARKSPHLSLDAPRAASPDGDDERTFGDALAATGPAPGDALAFDDSLGAAYAQIPSWADRACLVLRAHYQCSTGLIGDIVGKSTDNAVYVATSRAQRHLPTLGHFGSDPLMALLFEDQLRATEHGDPRQRVAVDTLGTDADDPTPIRLPIAPRPVPIVDQAGDVRFRVKVERPEIARVVTAIVHLRLPNGKLRVHEPVPVLWDASEGPVWSGRLLVDVRDAGAQVERMFLFQGAWLLGGSGGVRAG